MDNCLSAAETIDRREVAATARATVSVGDAERSETNDRTREARPSCELIKMGVLRVAGNRVISGNIVGLLGRFLAVGLCF